MNASRDSIRNYPKFVPPTIANGRVYMATFSGKVNMYGIYNPDGVDEMARPDIAVYPNPFQHQLNIYIPGGTLKAEVSILNGIGQVVYNQHHDTEKIISRDLDHLCKGLYFLQVKTEDKSLTTKIIKSE